MIKEYVYVPILAFFLPFFTSMAPVRLSAPAGLCGTVKGKFAGSELH